MTATRSPRCIAATASPTDSVLLPLPPFCVTRARTYMFRALLKTATTRNSGVVENNFLATQKCYRKSRFVSSDRAPPPVIYVAGSGVLHHAVVHLAEAQGDDVERVVLIEPPRPL